MNSSTKLIFLGTGTSTGVPVIGCDCKVCSSTDFRDNRYRTSAYIYNSDTSILIDSGPDLRSQFLENRLTKVDSVLYTHTHADHIYGLDDLRIFNFKSKSPMKVYGNEKTISELARIFNYAFNPNLNYKGGATPSLEGVVTEDKFNINNIEVTPIPIFHGDTPILGFRFGDTAYLTDCSRIPEESYKLLEGLNTLILNGLRMKPHNTHFTIDQAISEIEKIKPKRAYLTHISHDVLHEEGDEYLKSKSEIKIELAYDTLEIDIEIC